MLFGVRATKDRDQCRRRVDFPHHSVEAIGKRQDLRELSIATIAMAKAPWPPSREISEPDIGKPYPREGVEEVQLSRKRQITFDCLMGERPVLSPLDVDGDLSSVTPLGVEQGAVPERPDVGRRFCRVVSDPDDFLVCRDGERNPGPMNVVPPQEVVGDHAAGRVDDRDDSLQREPLVALDV